MVRHMVRHVVKHGHYQDFVKAAKALNEANPAVGLPRYRFGTTQFGTINEVWGEAEFESAEANVAAWRAARDHPEHRKLFLEFLSHLVDGAQHDYILEDLS